MRTLLVLAGLILAPSTALAAEGHCDATEQVVFSCSIGKKTVSVCASSDLSPEKGYVQYRFGPIGTPEISYPENPSNFRPITDMGRFVDNAFGGWIRFTNGTYRYLVYSHEWQSDGGDSGGISQGVIVLKDGNRLATLSCKPKVISDFDTLSDSGGVRQLSEDEYLNVEEIIDPYK